MSIHLPDLKIVIRGAGEMATGTAVRLHSSGFHRMLMTEIPQPLSVRRTVCFSESVHAGAWEVEGIRSRLIDAIDQAEELWEQNIIPVIVDASCSTRAALHPDVLIDAILAKRNTGTAREDARLVIGLGPGFVAGKDVHYVVETNRGHHLGRLISEGSAAPDTGVPGDIGGWTTKRVLRAPQAGVFTSSRTIGDCAAAEEIVGDVDGMPVVVEIGGILRGLIRSGTPVTDRLKIGDVDPRGERSYCRTVSEKARAIGGAVLEGILRRFNTGD
jgi:xanthine dehydrogenase accessory factor